MTDITDFLLARIAEDEYDARRAVPLASAGLATDSDGRLLIDPARVLAECEAKRRIVEAHSAWDENEWQSPAYFSAPMDEVLALLALPYVGHPDFREEWRP